MNKDYNFNEVPAQTCRSIFKPRSKHKKTKTKTKKIRRNRGCGGSLGGMVCLFRGVGDVAVLDAEDDVGVGAAAGALLGERAALQGGRQAGHRAVARPPRLAVVVRLPVALGARAMPHHLIRPAEGERGREIEGERERLKGNQVNQYSVNQ